MALWKSTIAGLLVLLLIGCLIGLAHLVPAAADEVAVYTLWLTIVTSLMAVATAGLMILAHRQFADSRLNNRAYVAVEPLGLEPWRGESDRFLGLVNISNVGVLPARALKWRLYIRQTDDGDSLDFPMDQPLRGAQVVAGRSAMIRGTVPTTATPARYCFVWGIVEYDDGYGSRRTTTFCHRYNCDREDFRRTHTIRPHDARQHEVGNKSD